MKVGNILAVIFGVIIVVCGIYCVMTPAETYMSLAWLLGLVMAVDGAANVVTWSHLRKSGYANGWVLVEAIISIVFGIAVLGSFTMQLAVDLFFAYMVAIWLVVTGFLRIGYGWQMRKLNQETQSWMVGKYWWLSIVVGILVVVLGILCMINPVIAMAGIGMLVGMAIIVAGVSVIALAF